MSDERSTKAARLWAAIENELIRKGFIHEGRELRERRADMVRVVGDNLGTRPLKPDDSAPTVRARARDFHTQVERLPARAGVPSSALESTIRKRLDQYIERSIYGAKGYENDDDVEYR